MPIKKAAFKALRQSRKNAIKNQEVKRGLKNLEKKIQKALAAKNREALQAMLSKITKTFDKAVKTGTIKKNTAARKKSRLMKTVCSALKQ